MFPTCYGSEFISRDLDLWAYANDVTLDVSRPGKPTDNGYIEAFNSKFLAECLNVHWFLPLADAPKVPPNSKKPCRLGSGLLGFCCIFSRIFGCGGRI